MTSTIAFDRVGHFTRVLVALPDGSEVRFLLDSGIGVTIFTPQLADRLGLEPTGPPFVGRRMSGQAVEVPLALAPALQLGEHLVPGGQVGVLDLGLRDDDTEFDGILGLDLLSEVVVTVDPAATKVHIEPEHEPTPDGTVVEVQVERDGPSVCLYADLQLPSGRTANVEIDTGSDCLILDSTLRAECGIGHGASNDERVTGTDETGHTYTRTFNQLDGAIYLSGHPATRQDNPRAMFQRIIRDGLLGTQFLDCFVYSFDTPNSRLILTPLQP